jgi:hypothetical protein
MNGASGFQEVRSSISRSSTNGLLREQRPQFGTDAWHLLRTHDLSALSRNIITKQDKAPDTIFILQKRLASRQSPFLFFRVLIVVCIFWLFPATSLVPIDSGIVSSVANAYADDSKSILHFGGIPWNAVYNPCIEAITSLSSSKALSKPRVPIPEPGPLIVGCKLVDCGPGTDGPGPIDLRINLAGDLAQSVTLKFENMTARDAARIVVKGTAKYIKNTTSFEVRRGTAVLRGFGANPTLPPPVATPRLTLNREVIERLKQSAKTDTLLANTEHVVTLDIEQFRGRATVDAYGIRFTFRHCLPPPEQDDHVRFSTGVPKGEVLVLSPGRKDNSASGCADYNDGVRYSSGEVSVGLWNHLQDVRELTVSAFSPLVPPPVMDRCHSEVVVYSKSTALEVVQPVVPPWTSRNGDQVPVGLRSPLQLPVTVWILYVPPSKTEGSVEDNIKTQIATANTIYPDAGCGITFPNQPEVHIGITQSQDVTVFPGADQAEQWVTINNFYTPETLNIYAIESLQGTPAQTSPNNTGLNKDMFGDKIFVTPLIQADTVAHEFGHTLGLLDVQGMGFSNENSYLMYGRTCPPSNPSCSTGRTGDMISRGQCYRANVDEGSFLNSPDRDHINTGIRSGVTKNICPPNKASSIDSCPDLDF